MKKLLTAFTMITFFSIFSARALYCQSETTMQDILDTVNSKVAQLEDIKKQEVVNITIDLVVNQSRKSITRVLDPNYEYTILVIGDRRISKLNISAYLQGKNDKEFVNESSGLNPAIKIEPDSFNIYEITVSAREFKRNESAGHFAILIYHGDALNK